jgi:hypothetical protein
MIALPLLLLAGAAAAAPLPTLTARAETGATETDACSYDFSYAQVAGLPDAAAQALINAKLKDMGTMPDACANPPDAPADAGADAPDSKEEHHASSGASAVLGGRYLLAESSAWEFTGGAHGNGGSSCAVLDLRTGETVSLAASLRPDAAARVRERVVAEVYGGDKDAADGFLTSGGPALSDADICPTGKGLTLHFNTYEVASYADGEKEIAIGPRDWRSYFLENEATRAVFAGGSTPVPADKAAAAAPAAAAGKK